MTASIENRTILRLICVIRFLQSVKSAVVAVKIGKISGINPPLPAFSEITKKKFFLRFFLLTLFENMLQYAYVCRQANINRQ